jgi:hypothetical protein
MVARVLPPEDGRSDLALRLYFAMLENMANSETIRLTRLHEKQVQSAPPDQPPPPLQLQFGMWLGSTRFHTAALCVALEVVLYAHADPVTITAHANTPPAHSPSSTSTSAETTPAAAATTAPGLLFPTTLQKLDLSAWEFLKNLEPCVRNLPTLLQGGKGASALPPPSLKQYLKRLESECLCWRIWAKGSPLLHILEQQDAAQAAQAAKEAAAAIAANKVPDESKSAGGSASSAPAAPAASAAAATSPEPVLLTPLWGSLAVEQLFTRQLLALSASRLFSLLSGPGSLEASNMLLECCWELLLEVFANHKNLLHNRHLDTVLLCVIYNIVVKIAGEVGAGLSVPNPAASTMASTAFAAPSTVPLDFKKIIAVYLEHMPHNGPMVISKVSTYHASSQPPVTTQALQHAASTAAFHPPTQAAPAAANNAAAAAASSQSTASSTGATQIDGGAAPSPPSSSPPTDAAATTTAAPASSTSSSSPAEFCNIIQFYNKYFIHEIKNFALDQIKPKMAAALKQAQVAAATGRAPPTSALPAGSNGKLPLGAASPLTSALFGSPATHLSVPGGGGFALGQGLHSPSLYSPLRGGRHAQAHRYHPYALTAPSPLPTGTANGAQVLVPPSSIHAYLSPRKVQIQAAQNVYISRMQPSPLVSAAKAATRGHGSAALPPQPPSSTKLGLGRTGTGASSVATAAPSSTVAASMEDSATQDALQVLTTFPLSPGPPLAAVHASLTPRHPSSSYHSQPAIPGSAVSTGSVPLTPKSRALYAFGESPRHALDAINGMLRGHQRVAGAVSTPEDAATAAAAAAAGMPPRPQLAQHPLGFSPASFVSPGARSAAQSAGGSGSSLPRVSGGSGQRTSVGRALF